MNFLTNTIISGTLYDLIKEGIKLSVRNVFKYDNSNKLDYTVCQEFIYKLNNIEGKNSKIEYSNKLLSEENKYTTMFEENMYMTNFAKRLDYVFTLMKDCSYCGESVNIEKLGEFLGFKSVNDLKQYYLSPKEPDYEFIKNVAEKLGVSVEWMKYGDGMPFKSSLNSIHNATEILNEKDFNNVKEYIFVINDDPHWRNIGIIRRLNHFKYDYYPRTLTFHAGGGGGGSELFSVYRCLNELNDKGIMPSGVYKVTSEQFKQFFNGNVYPGTIKKYKQDGCEYLLDDFIDLYNTEETEKQYEDIYGEVFVKCQDIIKKKLSKIEI
ncbi:TPA: hypothetical protein PTV43_002956 [Clostridium botulinum]|nr:hypothetical protein [Clostridium botulinum]